MAMTLRPVVPALGVAAFLGALLAAAAPASATTPDPRFTTTDLVVVGNASGAAIGGVPAGFDVVVRDVNNAPLPGRIVTLSFAATAMKVSSVQNAGTTVDCAARTISRVTNAAGAVNIAPRVSGYENGVGVEVLDNGVRIATVRGRSTDLDGVGGATGLGDFALFAVNFLTHQAAQETDYDLNGTSGLGDFALFASEFLSNASQPYCP
jgi:hypothetical protein